MSRQKLPLCAVFVLLTAVGLGQPPAQRDEPARPLSPLELAAHQAELRVQHAEAMRALMEAELQSAIEQNRRGDSRTAVDQVRRLRLSLELSQFSVKLAQAGKARENLNRQAVKLAMEQPVSVDFAETPLADVAEKLGKMAGINIQLDRKALDDVGIGTDTPITIKLEQVTLRAALHKFLDELDCTLLTGGEVLLITTKIEADSQLSTEVYDVHDLLSWDALDRGRAAGDYDAAKLVGMIQRTVAPTTWDEVGGPGSIEEIFGTLVVSQTQEVHDQVLELLSKFRHARLKRDPRFAPLVK